MTAWDRAVTVSMSIAFTNFLIEHHTDKTGLVLNVIVLVVLSVHIIKGKTE